jgi:hypothetical protein
MTEATPYDRVPYTSFPYPRTHPDRMNLVARLCGIHQSRALLDFVARNTSEESPYGSLRRSEIEMLANVGDDYLYHDLLEERNEPLYFHHFIERAVEMELTYLGEAEVTTMLASNLSPEVSEKLSGLASDIIATEQYMDFIRNRSFRSTLVCHSGIALRRNISAEATLPFLMASPMGGTRSHPELASALAQLAEDRVLRVDADGEPITDRDQLESVMGEVLGKVLHQMRGNALLEA